MDVLQYYGEVQRLAAQGAEVGHLVPLLDQAVAGNSTALQQLAVQLAQVRPPPPPYLLPLAAAAVAVALGVLLRLKGRELLGWLWLRLRRGSRVAPGGVKATLLFDPEAAAAVAALAASLAVLAVALSLGGRFTQPFSALSLLGPQGDLGGYPEDVALGQPIRLNVLVYNHMKVPVWYVVQVKAVKAPAANWTGPAPAPPIYTAQRVLPHDAAWLVPVTLKLNQTGLHWIVAELWVVQPNGTLTYTGNEVHIHVHVR